MSFPEFIHQFPRRFKPNVIKPPKDFVAINSRIWTHPNLVFEIGAGRGKHAHLYAKAHPDHHIIAIERTKNKAQDLLKNPLPNLTAIHADAIFWSVHALPPACLSKVYILYPNPELANTNQRFVNMPYFEFLISRVKVGGQIIIASNIDEYIDEACQKLTDVWRLPFARRIIETTSARTHFEIKYLARGETCQEIIITKPEYYPTAFDGFDKVHMVDFYDR